MSSRPRPARLGTSALEVVPGAAGVALVVGADVGCGA
jgi:hypothetical protein